MHYLGDNTVMGNDLMMYSVTPVKPTSEYIEVVSDFEASDFRLGKANIKVGRQ